MDRQRTFGSLFAGIGGFDLGFERPVICGGFPCQDISYAGRGAGLEGERSGLFFEAIRVVRELRPRIVVLENVAALLTRGLDRVLGTLAEIGFDAEWHCIPAAAVGAPHIRDRVFVVANSISERVRMQGCGKDARKATGVQKETQKRKRIRIDARSNGELRDVADTENSDWRKNSSETRSTGQKQGQQSRGTLGGRVSRFDWWETEPAVGRVADGIPNRVDRLRGLGNAVVPQVAEWIGKRIVEAANG